MSNTISFLRRLSLGVVLISMTGCAMRTDSYRASMENLELLRGMSAKDAINVAKFTATKSSERSILCRKGRMIKLPLDQTFEKYIYQALVRELTLANLYVPDSDSVLSGHVDLINLESDTWVRNVVNTFKGGRWTIQMTFKDNLGETFTIGYMHEFDIGHIGGGTEVEACTSAAEEFMPAVQIFINRVLSNSNVRQMVGGFLAVQ